MAETPAAKPGPIQEALSNADVPRLYANGFTAGLSNADVQLLLQLSGHPIALVSMSYTLAKTLHQKMGAMISQFEAAVERPMLTTDDVDKAIRASNEKKGVETKVPPNGGVK